MHQTIRNNDADPAHAHFDLLAAACTPPEQAASTRCIESLLCSDSQAELSLVRDDMVD
jgi:hypothetical protein